MFSDCGMVCLQIWSKTATLLIQDLTQHPNSLPIVWAVHPVRLLVAILISNFSQNQECILFIFVSDLSPFPLYFLLFLFFPFNSLLSYLLYPSFNSFFCSKMWSFSISRSIIINLLMYHCNGYKIYVDIITGENFVINLCC